MTHGKYSCGVPPSPSPDLGPLVYRQPEPEFRGRRAFGVLVGLFGFGGAILFSFLFLFQSSSPDVPPQVLTLCGVAAALFLALLILVMRGTLRERPFQLHERGILAPNGATHLYKEFIEAHLHEKRLKKEPPVFLSMSKADGQTVVVGGRLTSHVTFHTWEFAKVSALIIEGVRRYGSQPEIPWDPGALAALDELQGYRSQALFTVTRLAKERGVALVDRLFLQSLLREETHRRSFWKELRRHDGKT